MGTPRHLNAQPAEGAVPEFKAYGVYRPEIVCVRATNPVCSLCPFLRRSYGRRGGVSGAVPHRWSVSFTFTPAARPKSDTSDFGQRRPRSDEMCFESAVALRIYLAQRMSTAP
jgi:hypothetical protein